MLTMGTTVQLWMRRCFGWVLPGPCSRGALPFLNPLPPSAQPCPDAGVSCFRSYEGGFVGALELGDLGGAGWSCSLPYTRFPGRTPASDGCPLPRASRRFWSSFPSLMAQGATVFPLSLSLFLAASVFPGRERWPSSSCRLS